MKKSLNAIGGVGDVLQLLAVLVFVAVGPFFWMWKLIANARFGQLALVGLFWLLSLAIVGCEVWRKSVTLVSLAMFLTWMVVLGFVLF